MKLLLGWCLFLLGGFAHWQSNRPEEKQFVWLLARAERRETG